MCSFNNPVPLILNSRLESLCYFENQCLPKGAEGKALRKAEPRRRLTLLKFYTSTYRENTPC